MRRSDPAPRRRARAELETRHGHAGIAATHLPARGSTASRPGAGGSRRALAPPASLERLSPRYRGGTGRPRTGRPPGQDQVGLSGADRATRGSRHGTARPGPRRAQRAPCVWPFASVARSPISLLPLGSWAAEDELSAGVGLRVATGLPSTSNATARSERPVPRSRLRRSVDTHDVECRHGHAGGRRREAEARSARSAGRTRPAVGPEAGRRSIRRRGDRAAAARVRRVWLNGPKSASRLRRRGRPAPSGAGRQRARGQATAAVRRTADDGCGSFRRLGLGRGAWSRARSRCGQARLQDCQACVAARARALKRCPPRRRALDAAAGRATR